MTKNRQTTISFENGANKKTDTSPKSETANILGF